MNCKIWLVSALLLLLSAKGALAFQCNIATTPVNFGSYDVFSATALDSTGSITVTCNNPEKKPLLVTVDLTAGNSGSFAQRKMSSTTAGGLFYNLYADSARSKILGDGSGGSVNMANIISKITTWNITIYGRIPARQNMIPGVYSDSLTVTVIW